MFLIRNAARRAPGTLAALLLVGACLLTASAQKTSPQKTTNAAQVETLYRQGTSALQRGDLAGARKAFEEMVRVAPRNAEGHDSLGWVLLSQGELEPAISHFRKAMELKPHYVRAYINLATALSQKGDGEEAIARAREAVQLAPKDAEAHRTLGRMLSFRGDLEGATTELKKALELGSPASGPARRTGLSAGAESQD